jgi:hypothetical protein
MKRPFTVVLLTILAVIAGILAVIDVLRYLSLLPVVTLGPVNFFGFSFIGAIMAGIVAAIWFWAAQKLWTLDPQGWIFVVVIAIVYLIFDFVAILGQSSFQAMLPSILVSAIALILGLLPGTKEAFGQP